MHVGRLAASHEFIRLPLQSVISRPAPSAVDTAVLAPACILLHLHSVFFLAADELAIHVHLVIKLPRKALADGFVRVPLIWVSSRPGLEAHTCAKLATTLVVLVSADVAVHSSAVFGLVALLDGRLRLRVGHRRTLDLVHRKDKLSILNVGVISYKFGAVTAEGDIVAGDPP